MGRLIRKIRLEKSMTQKELSEGIISRSHLSELERGYYFCSYDKFILLIKRLDITLSEFDSLLDRSYFKNEKKLYTEAIRAINSQDINKIYESSHKLKLYIHNSKETSRRLLHLDLLYEAVMEYQEHGNIMDYSKYSVITEYLFSINTWNRYELNLLNNFLFILQPDMLEFFSKKLTESLNKNIIDDNSYTPTLTRTLINIGDIFFKMGKYSYSQNVSKKAIDLSFQNHLLYEFILSKINYLLADLCIKESINPLIFEYIHILEFLGYKNAGLQIRDEIDCYRKKFKI